MKTKPTQHSVKELRGLGIQPNMLVIRTAVSYTHLDVYKRQVKASKDFVFQAIQHSDQYGVVQYDI